MDTSSTFPSPALHLVVALWAFASYAGVSSAQTYQEGAMAPVSCLIEPDKVIRLSTPVAGIVDSVAVDRGDRVAEGQVVARLDTGLEEIAVAIARKRAADDAQIASIEAQIDFLDAQARRNEQLVKRNAVSRTQAEEARLEARLAERELDKARLEKDLAGLQLAEAEARLDQKIVRSPVDGVVMERLLNPGEYREGEAHILTIARLDQLRVEAFVPISYYDRLELGQTLTILPEAPLDTPHPAQITVIDQVFDAATATVGVRLMLDNSGFELPAGLRCELRFDDPGAVAGIER
ncbi:efflux RND transporter periplasmic adaptor subunit [Lutimaribacter marinistellae]|uniref:Efflux RND transporter periplasmic adaptor subunit n=1 Tax=Lutimaribacter marinistellae TaxID=1820329 RepID=A0ABV7TNF6_9RHOB